jgi:hypothetical protein
MLESNYRFIISFIWLAMAELAKSSELLAQEYYTDPKTNEPLGTKDILTKGSDRRVQATPVHGKSFKLDFDVNDGFKFPVGSGNWGSIQTSAYVLEKPSGQSFDSLFCKLSSEDMNYHYSYSLGVGNGSKIVEYEAQTDLVFLFTADKVLACIRILNRDDTILNSQWVSSSLVPLVGDVFTGDAQNIGLGFEKTTGYLYVASLNGLFRVDHKTQAVVKVADGVFKPYSDIVYTDCNKGVLVVAYRIQGVFAYDVSKPNSIKLIATFDGNFFQSQAADKTTLKFTFFVIQSHLVQIAAANDGTSIKDDLIGSNLYNYTNIMLTKDLSFDLLVVSTNQGIFFADVTQLLGPSRTAPQVPLPRKLNFNFTIQMARFQNTLYFLEQNPSVETSSIPVGSPGYRSGSTITEILLTANEISQWVNIAVPSSEIFFSNRGGEFPFKIKSVFADAQYMYLISSEKVIVFGRGIQSQYDEVIMDISNTILEPKVFGTVSFMFSDVRNMALLTFGDIRMAAYNLSFSGPTLSCGKGNQKAVPGKYKILLNATTRDCPQKIPNMADPLTMTYRDRVLNPCNWQVEIILNGDFSWFRRHPSATGWILLGIFSSLFVSAVIVAVACICRSNNLSKQKQTLEEEMKRLNSKPKGDEHKSFKKDPFGVAPEVELKVKLPQSALDDKATQPMFDNSPPRREKTNDNLNDTMEAQDQDEPPNYQDEEEEGGKQNHHATKPKYKK